MEPEKAKESNYIESSNGFEELFEFPGIAGSRLWTVIEHVIAKMPALQAKEFVNEQDVLIRSILSGSAVLPGAERNVEATVAIVFEDHTKDRGRAYLPTITRHTLVGNRHRFRVAYIGVTGATERTEQGHHVCTLSKAKILSWMQVTMTPPSILSKSEYYAPTPILKIDATKRLSDFNIAARVLLGSDLAGYQHQPMSHFLVATAPRVKGDFLPQLTGESSSAVGGPGESDGSARGEEKAEIDGFQSGEFQFCTSSFGLADLRSTAFEMIDADSGQPNGTTVFLEIREIEKEHRFNEHLRREWKQQHGWDIYAISYDRVLPNVAYYQEVVARHVDALSAPGIVDVLDLGGGTGNIAIPLLRQGKQVTVVDISRAMLDKLRCKLRGSEHRNLSVLEQSAEDLSQWENASFDGVNILLTLFNMANPHSALNEAVRVLRPGGLLVVTEPKRSFNLQAVLDLADMSLRRNGLYEEVEEDWKRVVRVNRAFDPSLQSSLFVEDVRSILRDVGFLEMRTEESHQGNCLTVWAKKPEET